MKGDRTAVGGNMKRLRYRKEKEPSFFFWGFHLFNKWLQIKNNGKSLAEYFEDNAIRRVAVYGLGAIGNRLIEELRQEDIEVVCGIDRKAAEIRIEELDVKTLEEDIPEIDAVIVTPIFFYEIQKEIYRKMGRDVHVVYIEDVIDYCLCRI
jgi:cellobiose-specific phosphotransferase system component IIB